MGGRGKRVRLLIYQLFSLSPPLSHNPHLPQLEPPSPPTPAPPSPPLRQPGVACHSIWPSIQSPRTLTNIFFITFPLSPYPSPSPFLLPPFSISLSLLVFPLLSASLPSPRLFLVFLISSDNISTHFSIFYLWFSYIPFYRLFLSLAPFSLSTCHPTISPFFPYSPCLPLSLSYLPPFILFLSMSVYLSANPSLSLPFVFLSLSFFLSF